MKLKNTIGLGLLILLVICLSLIYYDHQEIKESFQELSNPSVEMPKIDTTTMDKLHKLAKDIQEVKADNVPQETLDKISQDIIREIQSLQLALESQKKIDASLAKAGNTEVINSLSDGSLLDRESIKEKQLLQNYRIQKLEDKISNLRNTYQDFIARKNQAHYPKIPIYSSCVISEPDDGIVNSDQDLLNKPPMTNYQSTLQPSVMAYNPFKIKPTPVTRNETPTLERVLELLSQGQDINLNFDIKK